MNIVAHRKRWYTISACVLIPAAIALAVFGLRLGIDFTGGSVLIIQGSESRETAEAIAKANKAENLVATGSGQNQYQLRYRFNEKEDARALQSQLESQLKTKSFEIVRLDQIGPSVSSDLKVKAVQSLAVLSLVILIYVTYAFRKVPKKLSALSFGAVTIGAAFLHDALFVLGAFALLGHFAHVEVDTFIITAILTVIGFSIHDTIVVFDRIREKLTHNPKEDFEVTVETSLQETLVRSLNTSMVIVLVLLALFLFGGASTRYFILALLLGMISGTYSSIFIASPLLVSWNNVRQKRAKSKIKNAKSIKTKK